MACATQLMVVIFLVQSFLAPLATTDIQEEHTEEDENKVEGLCTEVLLMEQDGSTEEEFICYIKKKGIADGILRKK